MHEHELPSERACVYARPPPRLSPAAAAENTHVKSIVRPACAVESATDPHHFLYKNYGACMPGACVCAVCVCEDG